MIAGRRLPSCRRSTVVGEGGGPGKDDGVGCVRLRQRTTRAPEREERQVHVRVYQSTIDAQKRTSRQTRRGEEKGKMRRSSRRIRALL